MPDIPNPICGTCGREVVAVFREGELIYPIHQGDTQPGDCPPFRVKPQGVTGITLTANPVAFLNARLNARDKIRNVPNKPKTPTSTFRIPTELKTAAQERAEAEGKTLTDVVVDALTKYAKGKK